MDPIQAQLEAAGLSPVRVNDKDYDFRVYNALYDGAIFAIAQAPGELWTAYLQLPDELCGSDDGPTHEAKTLEGLIAAIKADG